MKKNRKRKVMWILLLVISLITLILIVFLNQPSFGRLPRGERQVRIEKSKNYQNGKFQNVSPTTQVTSDKPKLQSLYDFLFRKVEGLEPETNLPAVKTDLKQIEQDKEIMVWMGHSSLFIQTSHIRFLVDPVLVMASPVSFVNKQFEGTNPYTPDDIPPIDYLLITHDHWDHLDYNTVKKLREQVGKVICGLGVGEYFEYWGYDKSQILEMDWNEQINLSDSLTLYSLPARHYSGRGFSQDKTLWSSYLIRSPKQTIYISGDSGYDIHFAAIGRQFPDIDLAILENGQYDEDWKDIHLMPDDLVRVIKDLHPKKIFTVHNSKYALGKHPWKEPLENISNVADKDSLNLITPLIGETVYLKDSTQTFSKWWEDLN